MEYKILQDAYLRKTHNKEIGDIIDVKWTEIETGFWTKVKIDMLVQLRILEEIKNIPKYKVGDYVVLTRPTDTLYLKIQNISGVDSQIWYNKDTTGHCMFFDPLSWEEGSNVRKPTKEELKLYFR